MCGICGIVSTREAASPAVLERMNQTMFHRGPDSSGSFVDGPVGLAMRRLSIIDIEHGEQPMASADGSVQLIQNGEIYNHRELRRELEAQGVRFNTHSDTEVLLRLYERDGLEFVERLRGMFAIAVWDGRRKRLVLARDPFGIKPLYWSERSGSLTFASELKALARHPEFSREIDLSALEAFLTFNSIPAPLTIFRDAHKLLPGHLLIWEDGKVTESRYARPGPAGSNELRAESFHDLAIELRERLRDSVKAHLVADVPVGVLLSGGLDSSALTALAASESSDRVSTFSIGFTERSFNELDQARQLAERYGTDHHELVITPNTVELLPEIVAAFDEPFADSSALPTYLVSKLASEHVKVVLSGEGGDELLGGYETYAAALLAERFGWAARALRPVAELLPSSSARVSLDYKLKRFTRSAHLPPFERHHGFKEIFSPEARAALLDGRSSGLDPLRFHRQRFAETAGAPLLARLQDLDTGIYLVDDLLVKTDRMSMAHSLETRVPFLDRAVAELAHALPTSYKVRGMAKKRILREALRPLVPEEIVNGRKRGFSIPAAAWLRGDLQPFAREVLSQEKMRSQGWFDPAAVQQVLDAHTSGREDQSRQLWGLMSFSLWHDQVLDGALLEPATS